MLAGDLRGFIERGECAQIRSLDSGLYQAIKTVGTHSVSARLHPEVQFQITVEVSPA